MVKYAGLISQFSQKEVDLLFKKSHRIFHHAHMTVLAAPRVKSFARLLIITPKNCGIAVKRHLLRRRLKHIFYQEDLFKQLKYDVVIIARKPLTGYAFDQLHSFFLHAVRAVL